MEKQDAFQGLIHIVIWNGDQHDHLIVLLHTGILT